eukprot:5900236-Prymnesium_polylepis.1
MGNQIAAPIIIGVAKITAKLRKSHARQVGHGYVLAVIHSSMWSSIACAVSSGFLVSARSWVSTSVGPIVSKLNPSGCSASFGHFLTGVEVGACPACALVSGKDSDAAGGA